MLILGSLPEREEASAAYSRDTDPEGDQLGELVLPYGHWCWQ